MTLIAGPWVGEFGYELFRWQGYLRTLASSYEKVIVISRPGNEYLYADFATEYIPSDYRINNTDCGKLYGASEDADLLEQLKKEYPLADRLFYSADNRLAYIRNGKEYRNGTSIWDRSVLFCRVVRNRHIRGRVDGMPNEPTYICFGEYIPELAYDVVLHARDIVTDAEFTPAGTARKDKLARNWSTSCWDELAGLILRRKGLKACSIGLSGSSYLVPGTEDMRDIPLDILASILRSSGLCVGPSSGPLHLASLCGCPHLVWTYTKALNRWNRDWNPLGTVVRAFDTLYPATPVSVVYEEYASFIGELQGRADVSNTYRDLDFV